MAFDFRRFAIAMTGFCTFLNLYAPQALLPELSREFGVGAAEISSMITAGTLAIALTAPFTGAIADVLGRKRLIVTAMFAAAVPTVMVALAGDVQTIVVWRFIQGLMLPPIFTVALAYVGDEWPPAQVAGVAGIYVMGSSIGGFCGRLIPGLLSEAVGLARRVPGAGGDLARRRRRGGADAAARNAVPALRGVSRLGHADAAPPRHSAAARDLCGRVRRAVQLHRRLHLCELPPRRTAL